MLSIIIINYKTYDLTAQTLHSIYRARTDFPVEVILVDNA